MMMRCIAGVNLCVFFLVQSNRDVEPRTDAFGSRNDRRHSAAGPRKRNRSRKFENDQEGHQDVHELA